MRTRLSVCQRKRRFDSAASALKEIGDLRLLPYRCDRCGRFHLTSRTKGKWLGHRGPKPGREAPE